MSFLLQLRRDTSTNWLANDTVLAEGELAIELDTRKVKLGDGVTPWSSLGYFNPDRIDWDLIEEKPTFSDVAFSGEYGDLTGTPVDATQTTSGLLSSSDKSKLDGIESGAEVNSVDSVNNQTGVITLDSDDIGEGTANLYFTDTRAQNAIGVSGDLSYNAGVISFSETYSTPSELLTAIKTVDGSTSGLDADLLDGQHGSYYLDWNNTTNKPSFDNYGGWTLNTDGTSRGNIASSETVRFNGGSNTSLSYSATNNAITINSTDTTYSAGTGVTLSGTTFSLTDEAYTSAEKTKLSGIAAGAEVNTVDSVAGKTGAVSLTSSDVGLGSVRNVSSYSQAEADSNFVDITGDAMTGSLKINTADDGVNDLQVGGSSALTGDVGVGTSSPEEKLDVAGNARIRNENAMKFGGTGAADAQFAIQYNAATKSLDFNFLGG